ncbi:MAG: DUF1080 domain-containing protein [Verrucomicrobia bacterium]|nr:DUF1080 domain-containing protein [Verrucomicrobiota bacterium]
MPLSTRLFLALALLAVLCSSGCISLNGQPANHSEWQVLFDGKSTDKFRGFKKDSFPDSWKIEQGTLKTVPGNGTDIITKEQFDNFELQLEWKISPGGNSGVIYRVSEAFAEPWHTGPEMQVLDDDKHADGKNPLTTASSLYALMAATNKKLKPVGEWNQARLMVNGNHVEHWLNGAKVVEYELGSEKLNALIAKSKFADKPRFAKEAKGHIGLQHHHDEVWYRNIKIRRL